MSSGPAAPVTIDDLRTAGLYDPAAENAERRLELLEYLLDLGATLDDLAEYAHELPVLASALGLRMGRTRLTLDEVAVRADVPADAVVRLWRAAGFPAPGPEAPVFSDVDPDMFGLLHAAESLLGQDTVLQLVRVMGSAMSRVADAMVSSFIVNVAAGSIVVDSDSIELARANADAAAMLTPATEFMGMLLRRHMEALRRPMANEPIGAESFEIQQLAVGFADLVGSTTLAERLPIGELGRVIGDFERTALDVITAHGGRLVKLIGDEAMFVCSDPARACWIALDLLDEVDAHPQLPELRIGLAFGRVLSRDGDYFGPVVNLAARAAKLATPGAAVATSDVRDSAESDSVALSFDDLGSHALAGIETPIALLRVTREASS